MKSEIDIVQYLLAEEKRLSPFARKSSESLGRKFPIQNDPFRLEFARDDTRILHSPPFRRLKHKTQVFLSPDNDHICTRMEHVLHVSSIASIIGRCLGLNTDLIHAIAKAHDLGHAPFGHTGERVLDRIMRQQGCNEGFKHEIHGLRVVDKLTGYGSGLNLTYEVRDGIISHCGEKFEQSIVAQRDKDLTKLEEITDRTTYPSTLEGCLVRMVDRIAYLGRDLEDGIKAGLIKKSDIPSDILDGLGGDNGKIIGRFVNDTIANSIDQDAICLSDEIFCLMTQLKEFNYTYIYLHPRVEYRAQKAELLIEQLYEKLDSILVLSQRGKNTGYIKDIIGDAPSIAVLFNFIKNKNYTDSTPLWRIIVDYIAGMTDLFAQRSYLQLFLPAPVI
ncbi:MAG: HD domain-containing protein [Chitinivibrionales bacterium]|nr:HD domain-containing protein [Chitinivibrionales bacterium]